MGTMDGRNEREKEAFVLLVRELAELCERFGWCVHEINFRRSYNSGPDIVSVRLVCERDTHELASDAGAHGARADKANDAEAHDSPAAESGMESVCNTVCEISQHCRTHGCYARTVLDTE